MAAVTRVKARPVTPVGYEVNDKGTLTEDVIAGDQLVISGEVANVKQWSKCPTTAKEADGIALTDGFNGGVADVGIQGEMDGFSGMTPSTPLYPSGTTTGGLDTTAPTFYSAATTPAVAVPAPARVKAIGATRIRFNYL
ncbi:MAG: hypothetical protein BGO39_05005 [Chloroflexi bacterium 54-19]|nr:MAG: hypothetical protein BGO39_05005 [Chloroflexi bacterium 54-19]